MNEQYSMSTEIDYSIGYHHVNCDEYFWPDSEQRIYPCVLFLANTRDEKIYQENVSILSHMYKSLGNSKNSQYNAGVVFHASVRKRIECANE